MCHVNFLGVQFRTFLMVRKRHPSRLELVAVLFTEFQALEGFTQALSLRAHHCSCLSLYWKKTTVGYNQSGGIQQAGCCCGRNLRLWEHHHFPHFRKAAVWRIMGAVWRLWCHGKASGGNIRGSAGIFTQRCLCTSGVQS